MFKTLRQTRFSDRHRAAHPDVQRAAIPCAAVARPRVGGQTNGREHTMQTGRIKNAPRTLKSSGMGTWRRVLPAVVVLATAAHAFAASSPIRFAGQPSEVVLSEVSERTLRVELSPLDAQGKPIPPAPSPVLVSFSAAMNVNWATAKKSAVRAALAAAWQKRHDREQEITLSA